MSAAPHRRPGSKAPAPEDFFPDPAAESPLRWQTPEQQRAVMRMWAAAWVPPKERKEK